MALLRRSIPVDNSLCVWCDCSEETIEHILTGGCFSTGVWNAITTWCRISGIYAFHVKDLVDMHDYSGLVGNRRIVLHGIIIITCWTMWRARNEKLFSNKDPNVIEMVADIKTLGFLWYKHRFKQGVVDWERWCRFDLM
ncbi:uncharacterized protein LOC110931811 [Helianthus annuus]|uniref:uncharacterized protein LOC110931811 n=1 Tax=Helianthus annuus TaxID=4232 RepID=UPI000B9037F8|nr:uncharacterized protein LOC110931811 [Helianthus annuus]